MQWLSVLSVVLIFAVLALAFRSKTKLSQGDVTNPIAEANVYLAYGRKQQAIELLRAALAKQPNNAEIQARLKEIERLR